MSTTSGESLFLSSSEPSRCAAVGDLQKRSRIRQDFVLHVFKLSLQWHLLPLPAGWSPTCNLQRTSNHNAAPPHDPSSYCTFCCCRSVKDNSCLSGMTCMMGCELEASWPDTAATFSISRRWLMRSTIGVCSLKGTVHLYKKQPCVVLFTQLTCVCVCEIKKKQKNIVAKTLCGCSESSIFSPLLAASWLCWTFHVFWRRQQQWLTPLAADVTLRLCCFGQADYQRIHSTCNGDYQSWKKRSLKRYIFIHVHVQV